MAGCAAGVIVDRFKARSLFGHPLFAAFAVASIALPLVLTYSPEIDVAVVFGIAGIVTWVYLNQHLSVMPLMDWGPIGYLGTISYGLYMWQGVLTGNGSWRDIETWPPTPMVGALLTLIIAPISFHLFEAPIRKLGSRYTLSFSRRQTNSNRRFLTTTGGRAEVIEKLEEVGSQPL
jgi:peptidoglycan/LPS O-acetylase OafA/YrhL